MKMGRRNLYFDENLDFTKGHFKDYPVTQELF
jgi:hypothetical protein